MPARLLHVLRYSIKRLRLFGFYYFTVVSFATCSVVLLTATCLFITLVFISALQLFKFYAWFLSFLFPKSDSTVAEILARKKIKNSHGKLKLARFGWVNEKQCATVLISRSNCQPQNSGTRYLRSIKSRRSLLALTIGIPEAVSRSAKSVQSREHFLRAVQEAEKRKER